MLLRATLLSVLVFAVNLTAARYISERFLVDRIFTRQTERASDRFRAPPPLPARLPAAKPPVPTPPAPPPESAAASPHPAQPAPRAGLCPKCKGRGSSSQFVPCPVCAGTGYLHKRPCPTCRSTGKAPCAVCRGSRTAPDGAPCPVCGGLGIRLCPDCWEQGFTYAPGYSPGVENEPCRECSTTGKIEVFSVCRRCAGRGRIGD